MTNSELWDLLNSIGDFEYNTGKQRKKEIGIWSSEDHRLDEPRQKINHYAMREQTKGWGSVK